MAMLECCSECFEAVLPQCMEDITVKGGLLPDTVYYVRITDKFNNTYSQEVTTDAFGNFVIVFDDLPEGLFNPYAGVFTLTVSLTNSPFEESGFWFCDESYTCITFTIENNDSLLPVIECVSSENPPTPSPETFCSHVNDCFGIDDLLPGDYVIRVDEEGNVTLVEAQLDSGGGGGDSGSGSFTCDEVDECLDIDRDAGNTSLFLNKRGQFTAPAGGGLIVQTEAEWALDNTVYPETVIGVVSNLMWTGTDQRRFKIFDGVQTFAQLEYVPFELLEYKAIASTGTIIDFQQPKTFGTLASPESGNITDSLGSARIGVVQLIIHNAGSAPTVPAGWNLLRGSYQTSINNFIFCEWLSGTDVNYWIEQ